MTLTIRRLTVDDWRENRAIRLEALSTGPANFFTSHDEALARSDDMWRGQLMSATAVTFGLFDGDDLAGVAAIAREGRHDAALTMSYLRPAWRGRGLSAMFYAARLDWARAQGIRQVTVSHRASNAASRAAILRHGFTPVGRQSHRWPDGGVEDNILYRLELAP